MRGTPLQAIGVVLRAGRKVGVDRVFVDNAVVGARYDHGPKVHVGEGPALGETGRRCVGRGCGALVLVPKAFDARRHAGAAALQEVGMCKCAAVVDEGNHLASQQRCSRC